MEKAIEMLSEVNTKINSNPGELKRKRRKKERPAVVPT